MFEILINIGYNIKKSGLVVSLNTPFIAASPDGLIYDKNNINILASVEIKCPYNSRHF